MLAGGFIFRFEVVFSFSSLTEEEIKILRSRRMKKTLVMAFALMMAASVSFAAGTTAASSSSTGNWVIQVAGDVVIPTGDASNAYTLGFGGEAMVGYAFDQNFTLGVLSGYQNWSINTPAGESSSGFSAGYIPIELVAKYELGSDSDKIKPYGVLGAGVAISSVSDTVSFGGVSETVSGSTTDFLLDPGLGLAFVLSPKTELFVQGKVSLDFASGETGVYIPIQVGLNFGL